MAIMLSACPLRLKWHSRDGFFDSCKRFCIVLHVSDTLFHHSFRPPRSLRYLSLNHHHSPIGVAGIPSQRGVRGCSACISSFCISFTEGACTGRRRCELPVLFVEKVVARVTDGTRAITQGLGQGVNDVVVILGRWS